MRVIISKYECTYLSLGTPACGKKVVQHMCSTCQAQAFCLSNTRSQHCTYFRIEHTEQGSVVDPKYTNANRLIYMYCIIEHTCRMHRVHMPCFAEC